VSVGQYDIPGLLMVRGRGREREREREIDGVGERKRVVGTVILKTLTTYHRKKDSCFFH